MRRREFITLLGGIAVFWPFAAQAQQPESIRRVAALLPYVESDELGQSRMRIFVKRMRELGWVEGHNIRFDYAWAGDDPNGLQLAAARLVDMNPDVILAVNPPAAVYWVGGHYRGREISAPTLHELKFLRRGQELSVIVHLFVPYCPSDAYEVIVGRLRPDQEIPSQLLLE